MSSANNASAPVDLTDLRPCQSCGELVKLVALKCRFCGVELAGSPPLPELVARAAEILRHAEKLEQANSFPHQAAAKYGKKTRVLTWILTGIASFLTGLCVLAIIALSGRWLTILLLLLIPITICVIWMCLTAAYDDWRVPDDGARINPVSAFNAFFLAMTAGRWSYAYACILPGDKDETPRARTASASPRISGGVFKTDTVRNFKLYWQPVVQGYPILNRAVQVRNVEAHQLDDHNAVVTCRYLLPGEGYLLTFIALFPLSLLLIPLFNLLFVRTEKTLVKYLRRVHDRWYLVCGDIQSGVDLLPKLYAGDLDRLERGELPVMAAGRG